VTRILIVGAGPTGASLAYLLARRGIEVVLLEREQTFDRIFRGEGMMPSGIDALAQMGLRTQVEQLPHRKLDRWEFYAYGKLMMRFSEPDRGSKNAIRVMSQSHLLEMLVLETGRFPNFQLELGFSVRDLTRTDEGKIGVVGETASGSRTILGDFVIGTDGRASIIRTRSGLKLDRSQEDSPQNYDAIWCSLPLPEWLGEEMVWHGFLAKDSMATMYSSPDYKLRLGWILPKNTSLPFRDVDMLEEVARRMPTHVGEHILRHKEEASPTSYFKVLFGRCPHWSTSGILLLGDAAHPMNPQRAQGINLGLRDAIVAANYLVPVLRQGASREALDTAAQQIQQAREPEIETAQKLQLATGSPPALFKQAWFRAVILPVLVRLGLPQRMILRSDRELRYGVVPVQLEV
jgi:2-polyprenyl-6-methoxyphenol hydroxylase-like FAD-dependent oxidoreductase